MIGFAIRNWRILVDCLIVIAVILAFTYWDPFSIFNTRKLRQTASLVTGVREIGELVTAEYYGEVITSWKEFKLTEFPQDTLREFAEDLYLQLKEASSNGEISDGALRIIQANYKSPDERSAYIKFMAFLGTKYLSRDLDKIYKNEKIQPRAQARMLKRFAKEIRQYHEKLKRELDREKASADLPAAFNDYLDSVPPFVGEFYDFYSMLMQKDSQTGSNKKKNIVFIGRGWIKAGFRFDKFDENNFIYDRTTKIVHFYGLEPVILDKDINPWFIPQRKVKGFELVKYTGDVSFQDAKAVKKLCKEKLQEQAGTEILKRALENGKDALRNFFALLLDEPDLQVEFHRFPYQEYYAHIAADTVVTVREAVMIDTLYTHSLARIRKIESPVERARNVQFLQQFIERLKGLHFIDDHVAFNYYALGVAAILADSFHIAGNDFQTLLDLRGALKMIRDSTLTTDVVAHDSLWFASGNFMSEFNDMLFVLKRESVFVEGLDSATVKPGKPSRFDHQKNRWSFNNRPIALWDSVATPRGVKRFFFYVDDLRAEPRYLSDFAYDVAGSKILTPIIYNASLAAVREDERKLLLAAKAHHQKREQELSPIRTFSKKINDIISTFQPHL